MKANLRKIRKHRVYSEEFKREIVSLFESGKLSVLQIEKVYGISNSIIYRWIYKFSTFNEKGQRVVEMKASDTQKLKELEQKIKSLEQLLEKKFKTSPGKGRLGVFAAAQILPLSCLFFATSCKGVGPSKLV